MSKHSKHEDRPLRDAMLEALPRVRRFAFSLSGNRHDADDLLQSTVERVLTKPLPNDVDILKWMFRVCRNLWIDEIRARDVRAKTASQPETVADLLGAVQTDGEAVALTELTLREVNCAMESLPEEQRAVLSLVVIEGLSYREAADVLETPIGTVMSRLARARAALAARFEQRPDAAVAEHMESVNDR